MLNPIDNQDYLQQECLYIHNAIFGFEPPEQILIQYIGAITHFQRANRSITMQKIIDLKLDIEAIEYAFRFTNNSIKCRFQTLIYLTEAHPFYYSHFVNEESCPLKAYIRLIYSGVRSIYKFLKGKILIRRYSLV